MKESRKDTEQERAFIPWSTRGGRKPSFRLSSVIVDYLLESLEKVSTEVPSVFVVPFVPGGQHLVPGAEKRSPGRNIGLSSLAWYHDVGLLHDELEEGQATRGWLRCRRKVSLETLVYLAHVLC
jgi:hypothetical protein